MLRNKIQAKQSTTTTTTAAPVKQCCYYNAQEYTNNNNNKHNATANTWSYDSKACIGKTLPNVQMTTNSSNKCYDYIPTEPKRRMLSHPSKWASSVAATAAESLVDNNKTMHTATGGDKCDSSMLLTAMMMSANSRTELTRNATRTNNQIQISLLIMILMALLLPTPAQALINVVPTLDSDSSNGSNPNGPERSTTLRVRSTAASYINKLNNLQNNMAAVLMKAGAADEHDTLPPTTKRSILENNTPPSSSLSTISPPLLTTLRYPEKSPHQQQINLHHRNYELDLERDHALPTSAPNADILKSNSNPTYPNPNRHHNNEREKHRHLLNSTPLPSLPHLLKKNVNGQSPAMPPVYYLPGANNNNNNNMPSYTPPVRAFFTPPLPPEYQNPFADKPTLRGTTNEGIVVNSGGGASFVNRRPIPPPSLMPGHERIPLRPPDVSTLQRDNEAGSGIITPQGSDIHGEHIAAAAAAATPLDLDNKQADEMLSPQATLPQGDGGKGVNGGDSPKEILPSIRRILSGSNGNKGEVPEVLLKQVTTRPSLSSSSHHHHHAPSSPVVLLDGFLQDPDLEVGNTSNINRKRIEAASDVTAPATIENGGGNDVKLQTKLSTEQYGNGRGTGGDTISHSSSEISTGVAAASSATSASTSTTARTTNESSARGGGTGSSSGAPSSTTAAASHSTWNVAWNLHVYLSVILFTILAVYSFYKLLTYNKLTHLFSQSYFLCIHLTLIIICAARVFYLCYDAYNYNGSFHIFVSDILLNLPATFLTISFSVLMLFLFRKSLNHKNNRYSALIRPLTIIVGCGVHAVLCITLHYVESYTLQNYQHHQQQQQQQQQRQRQQQYLHSSASNTNSVPAANGNNYYHTMAIFQHAMALSAPPGTLPPPRVLSLICQIIYIFVCFSLGLLYLYLYRILKRILRNKSQNYIHGYQNLSYAIHITIATALLFVLLAALQIFGAISISSKRPLIATLSVIAELDWLHWGYQFSLRLIEVAIITLISWVAGLKTSSNGSVPVGTGGTTMSNGEVRGGLGVAPREKFGSHYHHHHQGHHTNVVAGFFLPCTSSSSQEQFETDYPAVCNANTNLHTYTLRTGKLIYDDGFALNSLGQASSSSASASASKRNTEFHQPTYQRPYDTGSLHSAASTKYHQRFHAAHQQHQYATADYLTDVTTDHYENPNFDLQTNPNSAGAALNAPFAKTTSSATSTTTASSSSGCAASASGASSQQQMLLLQNESCYSEPLQETGLGCGFNNFERPKFGESVVVRRFDMRLPPALTTTLDNGDRRSSNSCASSGGSAGGGSGGGGFTISVDERRSGRRYASYNSFERTRHCGGSNAVRKSGTLNNIVNGGGGGGRSGTAEARAQQKNSSSAAYCQNGLRCGSGSSGIDDSVAESPHEHDMRYGGHSLERSSSHTPLQQLHHQQHSSDHEGDDVKDIMLTELAAAPPRQPVAI